MSPAVAGGILIAGASTSVGAAQDSTPAGESVRLTRAWEFPIKDFNPLTYLSTVQELVFQYSLNKLISWNEDLSELIPDLAESWEISDDGLTYTFHLRSDVTWQDGEPFIIDDVLFTCGLALNPATISKFAVELSGIAGATEFSADPTTTISGITTPDDSTVVFTLTAANPLFLNTIARLCILPKHLLETIDPANIATSDYVTKQIVGTGAYQMVEFSPDEYVLWKANPNFFRGRPKIDEVVLTFRDASVLPAALQNDEVQLSTVAPVDVETVASNSDLIVQQAPTNVVVSLFFNTQTITDKRVRQAILYAIDRQTMIEKNILHPAASAVPAETLLTYPWLGISPTLPTYPYDPDRAKQLLAEANWDADRELNFLTFEEVEPTMVVYQQFLADVGIKVAINHIDISAFGDAFYEQRDFDLAFGGAGIGLDPDNTAVRLETNAQYNAMGYSNSDVDSLYAAGRETTSEEERIGIYQQMQDILNDELPIAALGIAAVNWAARSDIHEALFPQYADSINYIHPELWWIG